jgi:hypothetical protein
MHTDVPLPAQTTAQCSINHTHLTLRQLLPSPQATTLTIGSSPRHGYLGLTCARDTTVLAHALHVERRLHATPRFQCFRVSVWSDTCTCKSLTLTRSPAQSTSYPVSRHAPLSTKTSKRNQNTRDGKSRIPRKRSRQDRLHGRSICVRALG